MKMKKSSNSFVDWIKQKFSSGNKKLFAGAEEQQNHFREDIFSFSQLKDKHSCGRVETNSNYAVLNDDVGADCATLSKAKRKSIEKGSKENLLDYHHANSKSFNCDENKVRFSSPNVDYEENNKHSREHRNSKKKKKENRVTVIPALPSSSTSETNLKKQNSRFRFSFPDSFRRRSRKESSYGSYPELPDHSDCKNLKVDDDKRPKGIPAVQSLKSFPKVLSTHEVAEHLHGNPCENNLKWSTSLSTIVKAKYNNKEPICEYVSASTRPPDLFPRLTDSQNFDSSQQQQQQQQQPIVKVSHFFPNPPLNRQNIKSLSFPNNQTNQSDYVGFDVIHSSHHLETIPQTPVLRNSDPYVNFQVYFYNDDPRPSSQQSLNEDNYCLKLDDWTPAVPPRTYKREPVKTNFPRNSKSHQSFSSFTYSPSSRNHKYNKSLENYYISETIQQLPKSVALKCEAFCRRVDALPSDYVPMDKHPLSRNFS